MSKQKEMLLEAYKRGYRVDENGNVINPKGKIIRGKMVHPYKAITINTPGNIPNRKTRYVYVHRLQAFQKFGQVIFVPGVVVRHLNGNYLDNSASNIAIGTPKDNSADMTEDKRARRSKRRLTWEKAQEIKKNHDRNSNTCAVAKKYGVSQIVIWRLLHGQTYRIE